MESILELIFRTLVRIHVRLFSIHPDLGLINHLQLLAQKLRFRLVQDSNPATMKRDLIPAQTLNNFVVSVNDFYEFDLKDPATLEDILTDYTEAILNISD